MARFESQSQLLLLLLWNLDPFACWQAQVHCSWITKALIQTLFCRLWSEMQLAVGAPELCFLRQKKKLTIAFVARRWNITFQLIWSVWKGKEKRSVPDSGHSLLSRAGLTQISSKLVFSAFLCVIAPLTVAMASERLDVDQFQMISARWKRRHELRGSRLIVQDARWSKLGRDSWMGWKRILGKKSDADP